MASPLGDLSSLGSVEHIEQVQAHLLALAQSNMTSDADKACAAQLVIALGAVLETKRQQEQQQMQQGMAQSPLMVTSPYGYTQAAGTGWTESKEERLRTRKEEKAAIALLEHYQTKAKAFLEGKEEPSDFCIDYERLGGKPIKDVETELDQFWSSASDDLDVDVETRCGFPHHRVKRVVKKCAGENLIVSSDAIALFSRLSQLFIGETALRGWLEASHSSRSVITHNDVKLSVQKASHFDFLVSVVEESETELKNQVAEESNQACQQVGNEEREKTQPGFSMMPACREEEEEEEEDNDNDDGNRGAEQRFSMMPACREEDENST